MGRTFGDTWLLTLKSLEACESREGGRVTRHAARWRRVAPRGSAPGPRRDHAAVVLRCGLRVVLVGGSLSSTNLARTEVHLQACKPPRSLAPSRRPRLAVGNQRSRLHLPGPPRFQAVRDGMHNSPSRRLECPERVEGWTILTASNFPSRRLECPERVEDWTWGCVKIGLPVPRPPPGFAPGAPKSGRCGLSLLRGCPRQGGGGAGRGVETFLVCGGQQFGVSRGFLDVWRLSLVAGRCGECAVWHGGWQRLSAGGGDGSDHEGGGSESLSEPPGGGVGHRKGHGLVRLGRHLIVFGGSVERSLAPPDVLALDLRPALRLPAGEAGLGGLAPLRWRTLDVEGVPPSPRKGFLCSLRGGGRILVAGGFDARGEALSVDADAYELL